MHDKLPMTYKVWHYQWPVALKHAHHIKTYHNNKTFHSYCTVVVFDNIVPLGPISFSVREQPTNSWIFD